MGIFAKQDLPAGSEVTFDYQFQRIGGAKQQCWCGTAECRGYLGAKVRRSKSLLQNTRAAATRVDSARNFLLTSAVAISSKG